VQLGRMLDRRRRNPARATRTVCDAGSAALILLVLLLPLRASAQGTGRAELVARLDSIARAPAQEGRVAGLSAAVVRGADTLLLGGYGYADLELDVPTPPDAVYEIGSVTKQFTAAAILQLRDEGKLSLDDLLTDHLPEPVGWAHPVTIRRLLDHTSGIKGYTELPLFGQLMPQRLPRDTLVKLVAREPFDFAPGEALIYNNSAYFLLGLVIEKVSGKTYEEYVEERLFAPAGMERSMYCSNSEVVKGRAHGYSATPQGGFVRAAYLDHTWPYAAGSLCSTAGDMVAWNRALHGGRVLPESSYREMTTPGRLNDGTEVRYAMGIAPSTDRSGRRMISHGGGINGFLSESRWYPEEDLVVIVLVNTTGPVGPGSVADALAGAVLGAAEPVAAPSVTFDGPLDLLAGRFEGPARGRPLRVVVEREGEGIVARLNEGDDRLPLAYMGIVSGRPTFSSGGWLFSFMLEGVQAVGLRADHGGGHYVLAVQREGDGNR